MSVVQLLGIKLNVHRILQVVIIEIRDVENSSGLPFQHDMDFYVAPVISQKWTDLLAEQIRPLWKYKADTWLLMLNGLGEGLGIDKC